MGKKSSAPKGSKKIGRSKRKPCGKGQAARTAQNKLNRINRDRAKSGKPPLTFLPEKKGAR